MPKNAYLAKLQNQKATEMSYHRMFTIQFCADAAILAAHDVFQRKGEKLVEFANTFAQYANEIASMTMDDAKGDKTLEYTKAKIDEQLKAVLGEAFQPWDERYKI